MLGSLARKATLKSLGWLPAVLLGSMLGSALPCEAQAQPQPPSASPGLVACPAKGQAAQQPRAVQQATSQRRLDLSRKGFSACLESKGYTVR
jgi:hypothetical protein